MSYSTRLSDRRRVRHFFFPPEFTHEVPRERTSERQKREKKEGKKSAMRRNYRVRINGRVAVAFLAFDAAGNYGCQYGICIWTILDISTASGIVKNSRDPSAPIGRYALFTFITVKYFRDAAGAPFQRRRFARDTYRARARATQIQRSRANHTAGAREKG